MTSSMWASWVIPRCLSMPGGWCWDSRWCHCWWWPWIAGEARADWLPLVRTVISDSRVLPRFLLGSCPTDSLFISVQSMGALPSQVPRSQEPGHERRDGVNAEHGRYCRENRGTAGMACLSPPALPDPDVALAGRQKPVGRGGYLFQLFHGADQYPGGDRADLRGNVRGFTAAAVLSQTHGTDGCGRRHRAGRAGVQPAVAPYVEPRGAAVGGR